MSDIEAAQVRAVKPSKIKTTITNEEVSYDLTFDLLENKITIQVFKIGDLFKRKYSKSLTIEEFYKLNRIFKQYDDLGEIFESIKDREESKDALNISVVDDKLQLVIKFLGQKLNQYKEVAIFLAPEDSKDENVVPRLCDAVIELNNKITNTVTNLDKKIEDLKSEINLLTNILGLQKKNMKN